MDAKKAADQHVKRTLFKIGTAGDRQREAFLAGAAWALREFGDMLDEAGAVAVKEGLRRDGVKMLGWASEAHHIADGIES